MTIYTWGNWIEDFLCNFRLFWEFSNVLFVFISKLDNIFISKSFYIICFNDCLENRETMLYICPIIKFINKYSCNFDFITWSCCVNKIIQNKDFFLSRYTTSWHRSRSLLNCPLLVISVNTHIFFQMIWTIWLADLTLSKVLLLLINIIMIEWPFNIRTFHASKIHLFEFWKYSCSLCNHSSNFN